MDLASPDKRDEDELDAVAIARGGGGGAAMRLQGCGENSPSSDRRGRLRLDEVVLEGVCSVDDGQFDEADDEHVGVGGFIGGGRPSHLPRENVLPIPDVHPRTRQVEVPCPSIP